MGHRAKNKQPAPEPYETSVKKLGKRKADDERSNIRPAKKVKNTADSSKKSSKSSKKKKTPVSNDDGSASEGWEDVEDGPL